ncbi:MAG: hypothetical protein KF835_02075 [Xanthobacteraceae bacterium]|nr:hypothetical protein [Xanthobacteraceae bacterium]
MTEDIKRYAERWSAEDHASFEALCFHRVDEMDEPYSELMRAHTIETREVAAEIVKRAYAATKTEIEKAEADFAAGKPYKIDEETGEEFFRSSAEIFALAIAKLGDRPGRVASLVTASGPGLQLFECNTMHERGGPLNSYYTGPFSSGAVWDSFWFFENPYGEDSSLSFTTYHITKPGLGYCLWRWPERVAALQRAEETRKRNFRG